MSENNEKYLTEKQITIFLVYFSSRDFSSKRYRTDITQATLSTITGPMSKDAAFEPKTVDFAVLRRQNNCLRESA